MSRESNGRPPRAHIAANHWEAIGSALELTARELEIVQQLFGGADEAHAGRALGISVHTVHTHLGRLYRKLDVHGCSGLFLRVFDAYVAGSGANALAPSDAAQGPLRPAR